MEHHDVELTQEFTDLELQVMAVAIKKEILMLDSVIEDCNRGGQVTKRKKLEKEKEARMRLLHKLLTILDDESGENVETFNTKHIPSDTIN